MFRAAAVAAVVLGASPALAVVVVGSHDFGSLPIGSFHYAPTYFPATPTLTEPGRQAGRYTFTLPTATHLYVGTSWLRQEEYHCRDDTFPCKGNGGDYIDQTVTHGIEDVRIDLTRTGDATRRFDPVTTLTDFVFDDYADGEGFYWYSFVHEGYLSLKPGSYTFDFTGFGAPGGPAFPGSGGGTADVILSAEAVPEPATWVLLAGGFAVTGAALRRRSATASA